MFKKSTRRDALLLSNFKDGKFQDYWRRSTIDTANSQDITDVLDPDYSLTPPEVIKLFHEKQKLMRSVFDKVLHSDIGKKHVRENENDFNYQEIYKKLVSFCTKSTKARANATEILSWITSVKPDSWKVTSE